MPAFRAPGDFGEVAPLLRLCAAGRLYEVERWIADGHPLQFAPPPEQQHRRPPSALEIAVGRGFHSLAELLLLNGYDPQPDDTACMTLAAEARDHDMVDLLFRFGVSPNAVDFCVVLETCDRPLMDRFVEAGVDPCRGDAVFRALQLKRRPILGFVKQHWERFPCLQEQIDVALYGFADEADLRGAALMVWLGANPHARVRSADGGTAFLTAAASSNQKLLRQFEKFPLPKADLNGLFPTLAYATHPNLVRRFLQDGADPNCVDENCEPLLWSFLNALLWRFQPHRPDERSRALEALEVVLEAGATWSLDPSKIRRLRRRLLQNRPDVVIPTLKLLRRYRRISAAELHELTRTGGMREKFGSIV